MRHKLFPIALLTFLVSILISCSGDANIVELSEFKMGNSVLEDLEEIEILCASWGDASLEDEYYNHVIVISSNTGDTVNVLVPGVMSQSEGRNLSFVSFNSKTGKMFDPDGHGKLNFKHVYSDPQYIALDWHSYPTLIGMLVTVESTGDADPKELMEKVIQ